MASPNFERHAALPSPRAPLPERNNEAMKRRVTHSQKSTSASGALGQKRESSSLSNERHDVRTARHLQVRGWGETISRLALLSTDGDSALPPQVYPDTKGNPLVESK